MRDTWADHPDREERLRALWAEGHSTGEIARRLDISKNAVIGRAHRLDLPRRASPIRRGPAGAPKEPRRAKVMLPALPRVQIPAEQYTDGNRRRATSSIPNRGAVRGATLVVPGIPLVPAEAPKPVRRHTAAQCCYVTSAARPWRYCDAPTVDGVWCAAHRALVYVVRRSVEEVQAA